VRTALVLDSTWMASENGEDLAVVGKVGLCGGHSLSQAWMEGRRAGWMNSWVSVLSGESPRSDELPDQPHPHHPWGDGVHPT
jgi:hypothetical protein